MSMHSVFKLITRNGFQPPQPETWPPALGLMHSEYTAQDYQVLAVDNEALIWRKRLADNTAAIIKLYHHRGAISWVREHLFQFRVEREFLTLNHLHHNGIACSKPLFWTKGKLPHYGGRFEALATEEIPNAVSLLEYINTPVVDREFQTMLVECGILVRKMHACGVYHGALYSRNILIGGLDRITPHAYIIDTPKAIVYPFDLTATRLAEIDLMNLCCTLVDQGPLQGFEWFLDGYGIIESARTSLIGHLSGYKPTRHTRNLHRAYSGLIKLTTRKPSVKH
jgi:tRNA A-37 threonylcarbamoyl transferase component Bud32